MFATTHPWFPWRTAAVASLLLCAGCGTALVRAPGGNYTSKAFGGYTIKPLPDGSLMPAGWTLANFEQGDGTLRLADGRDDRDLVFRRQVDDGQLTIRSIGADSRMAALALAELAGADASDFSYPSQRIVIRIDDGTHWVTRASRPFDIPGGEGYEFVAELWPESGGDQPLSRSYRLWFRPASRDWLSELTYDAPPAAFHAGVDDVIGLVKRVTYT